MYTSLHPRPRLRRSCSFSPPFLGLTRRWFARLYLRIVHRTTSQQWFAAAYSQAAQTSKTRRRPRHLPAARKLPIELLKHALAVSLHIWVLTSAVRLVSPRLAALSNTPAPHHSQRPAPVTVTPQSRCHQSMCNALTAKLYPHLRW